MSDEPLVELSQFLRWRHLNPRSFSVHEICTHCQGAGRIVYGSTVTWRGGIGGAAMTPDACNRCWGSGDEGKPWPSHELLDRYRKALEREKSLHDAHHFVGTENCVCSDTDKDCNQARRIEEVLNADK